MAEDKKISQFFELIHAGPNDSVPIVDKSVAFVTKQITIANLFAYPQPIGSNTPKAGTFTKLNLSHDLAILIDEFSTDGTFSGNSNTALPTEKAVKTYVDTSIIHLNSDKIWAGDSYVEVIDDATTAGYVTIVTDGVEVGNFQIESQLIGVYSNTFINIDQTAGITIVNNSVEVMTLDENGLALEFGSTINEFSIDGTLGGDSDISLPTEKAVKTYVDNAITNFNPDKIWEGDSYTEVVDDGTTAGYVTIVTNGVEVGRFNNNGLTLKNGTYVDEFSTDVTLSGNSDIAIPTEKAVKTYADNLIVNFNPDKIWEGDSYVEVVDDSTATGYVTIVTDGVEVGRFDALSQRFGDSGDTNLTLNALTNTFVLSSGPNTQISGDLTMLMLGVSGDTTISLDQTTDHVAITAGGVGQIIVAPDGVIVYENLTVAGDLYVDGTTWVVHNQEVTTSDNMIVINYGEIGSGVTSGFAGFEVDRGSLTNYRFIFEESSNTFRIGDIGSLQAVATREDAPVENNVAWWNDTDSRFDTQGNTFINIDQTACIIVVDVDSVGVMTLNKNGLALQLGTTIKEFSIDGTLTGNSDTAVPTEKAVKTYADSGDTSTLNSANSYTDIEIANLKSEVDLINTSHVNSDSTAVTGDVLLVDTSAASVVITLQKRLDAKILIKKITSDGNNVTVQANEGLVDGMASRSFSDPNASYAYICDGNNFYIF